MVVLSVAICTKNGKALLSRQFVDTNRIRIEGLLAAFPKLISTDSGKQHTFVETDNVRYVYLPLEALYLVLMTNKGSNIMEDLDTLRLLSKVVPDQCGVGVPIVEETIASRAFELLFAFDEVISAGGYREDVNMHTIRTNLEMESHEEKLAQMIKASKMAEAKEAAKRKAVEIRARHREEEALRGPAAGAGRGGFGSSDSDGMYGGGRGASSPGVGRTGGAPSSSSSSSSLSAAPAPAASSGGAGDRSAGGKKGGMKLGGKGPGRKGGAGGLMGASAASSVMAEEGLKLEPAGGEDGSGAGAEVAAPTSGAAAAVNAATAAAAAASQDHATIAIEERLTAKLTRDGGVESVEVKGMLSLTVADEPHARLRVATGKGPGADKWAFTTHPNVNKAAFTADGSLCLKQPDRPFPVGAPLGVLRWRYAGTDESALPLTLNVWPEEGPGGIINVNIEYTLQAEEATLADVVITVPVGDGVPKVTAADGTTRHNTRENVLTWSIDAISADNASGSLEFSIKGKSTDIFFPVSVSFASLDLLCPIAVTDVSPLTPDPEGRAIRYSVSKSLAVDSYTIE